MLSRQLCERCPQKAIRVLFFKNIDKNTMTILLFVSAIFSCFYLMRSMFSVHTSLWYLPQAYERHLVATFDASAHSLGSRIVPNFVQSSQAIDRNPSQSNCLMLKLDYPSKRICIFFQWKSARTIQNIHEKIEILRSVI